jgi:hypothetical protein
MRWTKVKQVAGRRTVTKFLWWPKTISRREGDFRISETRWLEVATYRQSRVSDWEGGSYWCDLRWADDAATSSG